MGDGLTLASEDSVDAELRKRIEQSFEGMMSALYRETGASLRIGILAEPEAQEFIEAHAGALDSSFQKVEMSDLMRRRLQRSDYIFSGMKAFHEMNEAFPSLIDENGNRKSFERFLNDVRKIDKTYNSNYLRAEYNFVQASAEMAGKWEGFMQDGDRYYLQYRTARDGRVRPEHAALHGVTLPITDTFWEEFYPPNGWGCRCTVVQVRKSKYPATPHDEAMALGEQALQRDTKGMFRFNPGKEGKAVPDYNPYTASRCRDCDIAKGKFSLAKKVFIPDNELCQACQFIQNMINKEKTAKLTKEERREIKAAVEEWTDIHLPEVELRTGKAKRLYIKNTNINEDVILNKGFFSETFAKNFYNKKLAETMQLATRIGEWFPLAEFVRVEKGIHHNFNFKVFIANVEGVYVECKVKMTSENILYTMRIIK